MINLKQANFTTKQAEWVNTYVPTFIGVIKDTENAVIEASKLSAEIARQNGIKSFTVKAYQVWNGQIGEASGYYVTVGFGEYVELDWTKCPLCVAENTPRIETDF